MGLMCAKCQNVSKRKGKEGRKVGRVGGREYTCSKDKYGKVTRITEG